jgi:hypothetical protein
MKAWAECEITGRKISLGYASDSLRLPLVTSITVINRWRVFDVRLSQSGNFYYANAVTFGCFLVHFSAEPVGT